MSGEREVAGKSLAGNSGVIWGPGLRAIRIYLLRLLLGFGLWIIAAMSALGLVNRTHPEAKILRDAPTWFFLVLPLLPVLVIALVVFSPSKKGRRPGHFRGRVEAIAATRLLLLPAMGMQLFVVFDGGFGWGVANFLVAVGACFLVALALDEKPSRQFLYLLAAGSHGLFACLAAFFVIAATSTSTNRGPTYAVLQIEAIAWLGAIPSIILMGVLFFRCSGERWENGRIAVEPPLDAPREAPVIGTKIGELSPTESMAPALAAGAEGGYFYVGPDNEPVGPISWTVLLQLRRSGTIADETFVAREGESDWGPLKPRLAELESPAT